MTPSPRPSWKWAVCGALMMATFLNYMDRQALAVTLPTLKKDLQLAEGRVGWVEGCFGFAFAFGSLFFGWLADRTGPRFLYPAVLTGWSLAGIATSFAGDPRITSLLESPDDEAGAGVFRWLLLCRSVLGVCEAGHWPCALLTVRAILTAKDRTLGNSILQSGASLGAILVPQYVDQAEKYGQPWQFSFWSIGLAGLLWLPLWFALVRGRSLDAPRTEVVPTGDPDPALWRKLVVLGVIVGTLTLSWQFLRAWLVLMLQDHHGYTKQDTRYITSGYFIAADVGCLLAGGLASVLATRGWGVHSSRVAVFFLFTLLTACAAVAPFVGAGWLMLVLLFTAGAGILGLHPCYYSLAQELPPHRMGVLSGGLAAVGWVVSAVSQIVLGDHIQQTKSYETGLVMVGLAPVVGLVALVALWPRRVTSSSTG